ncbi:MAG TPA: hypothetical protein VFR20_00145 [Burkholderiaceae bacterium]|nr:hypothetical protein [Burkholderiaceae bacterium]
MKQLYKTLLVSALLAAPFATVQAHETQAQHEAWIKAQKIDVQPTLTIKETTIPASSVNESNSSSSSSMDKMNSSHKK